MPVSSKSVNVQSLLLLQLPEMTTRAGPIDSRIACGVQVYLQLAIVSKSHSFVVNRMSEHIVTWWHDSGKGMDSVCMVW